MDELSIVALDGNREVAIGMGRTVEEEFYALATIIRKVGAKERSNYRICKR